MLVQDNCENWNIQLLLDDISVSSTGSQISVNQQREEIELVVSEQDKDDYQDSTTVHSTTRDEGKKEVRSQWCHFILSSS